MDLNTSLRRTDRTTTDLRELDIVMADDDENDQLLMVLAAEEAGIGANFTFVDDGLELIDYLKKLHRANSLPNLIVLDLRMPMLDGHGVLDELQAHPDLWQIPVVVFTSSTRRGDVQRSLEAGARWYETKPSVFTELVDVVRTFPHRAAPAPAIDTTGRYPVTKATSTVDTGTTD